MITFEKRYSKPIQLLQARVNTAVGNKPLIPHLLRVGKYLHNHGYSQDIVHAGLLHDALEWTDISPGEIAKHYGKHVLDIVEANTKDRTIVDSHERRKDYINRCAIVGTDALIVKAADTLDSFAYYSEQHNEKELTRSKDIARLILENVSQADDPIFVKLASIV